MIETPEQYFKNGCGRCARFETDDCSARIWSEGLKALREICRSSALSETVKWGQPCYEVNGQNVAIIGALRGYFALSFFNAALLNDPDGVLQKQGPNTQTASVVHFGGLDDVDRLAPILKDLLSQGRANALAGRRAPKSKASFDLPDEFIDALDADPDLAEAFEALTPGRQRSYAIHLNAAKKAETRIARIAKLRPKIMAGKGANEY